MRTTDPRLSGDTCRRVLAVETDSALWDGEDPNGLFRIRNTPPGREVMLVQRANWAPFERDATQVLVTDRGRAVLAE